MNTRSIQLDQSLTDEESRDFPTSIECDHPVHTLIFGNRMCGKLEIVPSYSNESTVLELSETASREIEINEGSGTVIFTKRKSPYSFFHQDNAEVRHDVLIRAYVPQNSLRRVCARTRLASVLIKDYEAEEFSVNASLGGSIYLENVQSRTLIYEAVSGACTIQAKSLDMENLVGIAYSSAHVVLSGQVKNHRLATTNKAIVDARELKSEHASINCFHASRVHLGNVGSLTVQARKKTRVFLNQDCSIDADSIIKGHIVY